MSLKRADVLALLLLAALLAGSALAWPLLPAEVPTHFGARGLPDAWGERSFWSWFLLPLLAVAFTALLYAVAWALPRWPGAVNVPDKKKFLELPPERQRRVLEPVADILRWNAVVLVILFGAIQVGSFVAATRGGEQAQGIIVLALVAGFVLPVVALAGIGRVQSRLDEEYRAWRAGRPVG